ncbi:MULTISPECIES: hypothetical protein [Sphingobacterium]|uniref:hypothetical protein n=1 Tax=Sphingobacterium TaxID=28453 RepID=UPI000B490E87|nr:MULTISPECIES: hypothetical protein [Sphingobacterium]
MKRILALQFAFDWMIYDVHKVDYDPIKESETFWDRYALNTISTNILVQLSAYVDDGVERHQLLKDEEMQEFAIAVSRLLIASCIVNHRKLDITKAELPSEVNALLEKELELSKKIADFLSRLSK